MNRTPIRVFRFALLSALAAGISVASAQSYPAGTTPADPTMPATTPRRDDGSLADRRAPAMRDDMRLSRSDRRFLEKAAELNGEEIQISRVAAQRSTQPDVRALAQKMVSGHESMAQGLTTLATRKGVTLPASDADRSADWAKKSGDDLDEDYLERMAELHEDTVELFQKAAVDCDDEEIAAFASKQLPELQKHLRHTRSLAKTID